MVKKHKDVEIYYITIRLICKPDTDIQNIMADCDYLLEHENIILTELIGEGKE